MINIFKTVKSEHVIYGVFSDERELVEITVSNKKNKEIHVIDKTHEKPKYIVFDKTKTKKQVLKKMEQLFSPQVYEKIKETLVI
jgi:hypothetical protein